MNVRFQCTGGVSLSSGCRGRYTGRGDRCSGRGGADAAAGFVPDASTEMVPDAATEAASNAVAAAERVADVASSRMADWG